MNKRLTVREIQNRIDSDKTLKGIKVIRVGIFKNLSYVTIDRSCGHRETKQTFNVLKGIGCKHCKVMTHDKIKKELEKKYNDLLTLSRFIIVDKERFCRVVWNHCGHEEDRYLNVLRRGTTCSKCRNMLWYKD